MAASKVNSGWGSVSHGVNAITRVTAMSFDMGGSVTTFAADTDKYTTLAATLMSRPSASLTTGDVGTIFDTSKFAPGTTADLTATLKDAKAATGGDVVFVLSNAVVENVQGSGNHGQFASGRLTFQAYSDDGTTNPLAITRA